MFISAEGSVLPSSSSVSSFLHRQCKHCGVVLAFPLPLLYRPSSNASAIPEQAILTLYKRNSTVPRVAPILTPGQAILLRARVFAKRLCRRSMYSQLLQSIVRRLSCRFRRTDTDDATRASDRTRLDSTQFSSVLRTSYRAGCPFRSSLGYSLLGSLPHCYRNDPSVLVP